jgi:hypothetical protein
VWGADGAAPLVQWLGVPRRQTTWRHSDPTGTPEDLSGLVLLDLPDHDSTAAEHRIEVDRLVEMVDLLVWVVDPQKYADRVLHERYLRPLAGHDAVTVLVLNQVDTLNPFAAAECVDDLERLAEQDGLRRPRVLPVSAHAGTGMDALSALLAEAVRRRRARTDRLVADVESVIETLAAHVGVQPAGAVPEEERRLLVDALADAAGVPAVGAAVERSWRDRSAASTGWPPTRWVRRLRPDPLRRLHLGQRERREVSGLVRSSVPAATPVQQAQVERAVRRVSERVGGDLPVGWREAVRDAAAPDADELRDRLDSAAVGTDLGLDRTPWTWRAAAGLQWVLLAAAVVGAGWLALLALGGFLRLPEPRTPDVLGVPVPTFLLVGGAALGLLLAWIGRRLAGAGAVWRRRRAESRLRDAIEDVAERLVLVPVEEELGRYGRAREALERTRSG